MVEGRGGADGGRAKWQEFQLRYPFAGPPGLMAVGLALTILTLVLAYWGIPTALMAALSAWCLTWAVLPPARGITRQKLQLLCACAVAGAVGTWIWARAWS